MAVYATLADFQLHVPTYVVTNNAALENVLKDAELDIDSLLGPYGLSEITGLKVDPLVDLDAPERVALARATCFQAEYRIEMGEEFFVKAQHNSVSGPHFSTTGKLPYVGPKVHRELPKTGLRKFFWTKVLP
jgi:hypothetical protein